MVQDWLLPEHGAGYNRPIMVSDTLTRDEMIALLDWYRAAGVDMAVSEQPVDRFVQSAQLPKSVGSAAQKPAMPQLRPQAPAQGAPQVAATESREASPQMAQELAAKAQTLDELKELLAGFEGCGLKLRATNLVFADGNPQADIMFVGEAPGRDEDLQGKPFVGRSGQLLDRMLAAIGLDRTRVYIANTVPWRPPGNRTPTPAETSVCLPFLYRQIELVAPKVLVTLGGAASSTLFETTTGITRLRGQWRELTIADHTMQAMATLHPAFLLRQPAAKKLVWQDLLSIRAALDAV
ncbi:uracil-DNA glycosylase [Pelagibacterium lentulum]|uniref:Type-4 uracil-DNA glycosylase n=2 Tax=Pelagibacterium lentulum TaxID=2029865 RepID=A0A916W0B3_9HYPH|nr:uracil-DNA glycosylase [Pelagibacterium lentulum]